MLFWFCPRRLLVSVLLVALGIGSLGVAVPVARAQPLQLHPQLAQLSPAEQQRLVELSDRRTRRLVFPIVLTTLSSVGFLGVFAAYAALRDQTCYDDSSGIYHDCSMHKPALAFAAFPALGLAIGGWLLNRGVGNRREYETLIWKASLRPIVARNALGLSSSISF